MNEHVVFRGRYGFITQYYSKRRFVFQHEFRGAEGFRGGLKLFSPINPLRPNSDLSQTSHCNIKGLSVSEVMRIENMITQVKFN